MRSSRRWGDLRTAVTDVSTGAAVQVGVLTLVVVAGELLLFSSEPTAAAWCYFGLVLGCTLGPLFVDGVARVSVGFALVAVFRLTNLSMPVFAELTVYWLLLVYVPFLPITVFVADHIDAPALRYRWRRSAVLVGISVVVGSALAVVSFRTNAPATLIPTTTASAIALLAGVVILAAVVEELLFRVILQTTLRRHVGTWAGVALASGLFAATRLSSGGAAVVVALVAGLVYGTAYEYSGSRAAPILFHAVTNVVLYAILPVYLPSASPV